MNIKWILFISAIFYWETSKADVPVEVMAGHSKTTLDIMFFKYFKKIKVDSVQRTSPWLFFNRNRAAIDYRMTDKTNLPVFGFTEAISYNPKKLKGFAPVVVAQVLSDGVYSKMGIQYAKINKDWIIFSWLVCETMRNPRLDYFVLFRYTPKISNKLHLYSQFECVNTIPTEQSSNYSFVQRVRLGIQMGAFQFGGASDFSQTGNAIFVTTNNVGGFLRYDF